MAISSTIAITVSIVGAMFAVVIAAAVHRSFTSRNKGYDENGAPRSEAWTPNCYPPEQLRYMAEVRWRAKKVLWEIARDDRLAQGLGPPDWYPGDHFESGPSSSRPASGAHLSTDEMQAHEEFEHVPLGSPDNIGYAYRNVAYVEADNPESEEHDDFGVPVRDTANASPGMPYMLKRWTQHGAPRQLDRSFHTGDGGGLPRIMLNDNDIPLTELDSFSGARVSPYPRFRQRSSSVYSTDTPYQMPIEPPQAYVSSTQLVDEANNNTRLSESLDKSRVHQMIAQWERANGTFS